MLEAKPFLKWAGGKRQLLTKFNDFYPKELHENEIDCYFEPFLGGGAVYFDIYNKYNIKNAFLFDINEELVICYKVIKKDVNDLIDILNKLQNEYLVLGEEKLKEYYYDVRESYNLNRFNINYQKYSDSWIFRASQMIFLNKTCFNGLIRFNSLGKFNTPIGSYKNPRILDEDNLVAVSKSLENAIIEKGDYSEIEKYIENKSFVYYDPPYRPISKTSNFTSYSKYSFEDKNQKQLAKLFEKLDNKDVLQMLSNSDPKNETPDDNFFDELYIKYNIQRIPAKRSINSNAKKRKEINELVITNY